VGKAFPQLLKAIASQCPKERNRFTKRINAGARGCCGSRVVGWGKEEFAWAGEELAKEGANDVPVITARDLLGTERETQREIKAYPEIEYKYDRNTHGSPDDTEGGRRSPAQKATIGGKACIAEQRDPVRFLED
jgi:hypothetical protein